MKNLDNIIIIYISKHGAVKKCASILSKKLNGNVELYDLKQQGPNIDLSRYNKIIIGGSIYIGRINSEVREFCKHNMPMLKKKKIGLFISCTEMGNAAFKQLNKAFPQELLVNASAKDFFGGELKFKTLNFLEKFFIRVVSILDKETPSLNEDGNVMNICEARVDDFAKLMNG